MNDAVSSAGNLLQRGDVQGATNLLKRAEAAGDALAARELAIWLLEGRIVRRDLTASRSFFERAGALGDLTSARIFRGFVAGGVGGTPDWNEAMRLLRQAASSDPEAGEQLRLIQQMELAPDGEPATTYSSESLCETPVARAFRGIFSKSECQYLIRLARPLLQPSIVIDPNSRQPVPHPIRTSSGASFPFTEENPAVHALNRRLAAASGTDVRAGEPMWVLHYAPGEQYREHSDVIPGVSPAQQRVMTFLVYLNDDYDGGETIFPAAGFKFRGQAGDGLLFRNAFPDGTPDPSSVHAGLPVISGVKHLASRWIRGAPLDLG